MQNFYENIHKIQLGHVIFQHLTSHFPKISQTPTPRSRGWEPLGHSQKWAVSSI